MIQKWLWRNRTSPSLRSNDKGWTEVTVVTTTSPLPSSKLEQRRPLIISRTKRWSGGDCGGVTPPLSTKQWRSTFTFRSKGCTFRSEGYTWDPTLNPRRPWHKQSSSTFRIERWTRRECCENSHTTPQSSVGPLHLSAEGGTGNEHTHPYPGVKKDTINWPHLINYRFSKSRTIRLGEDKETDFLSFRTPK